MMMVVLMTITGITGTGFLVAWSRLIARATSPPPDNFFEDRAKEYFTQSMLEGRCLFITSLFLGIVGFGFISWGALVSDSLNPVIAGALCQAFTVFIIQQSRRASDDRTRAIETLVLRLQPPKEAKGTQEALPAALGSSLAVPGAPSKEVPVR
jgi:hypothetical protein